MKLYSSRFACFLVLCALGCDNGRGSSESDSGRTNLPLDSGRVSALDGGPQDDGSLSASDGATSDDGGATSDAGGATSDDGGEPSLRDGGSSRDGGITVDASRADTGLMMTCGNGVREGTEVCDGPGCTADCMTLIVCGDEVIHEGEQCDDGNTGSWDGCSAACQQEQIALVDMLRFATAAGGSGCPAGNRFAVAAGTGSGQGIAQLNMVLGAEEAPDFVIALLDLDDGTPPADDSSMRVSWHQAFAMGSGYAVAATSLVDGEPTAVLDGAITSNRVVATADEVSLRVPGVPLDFADAQMSGTVTGAAGDVMSVSAGQLCGVLSVEALSQIIEDELDRPRLAGCPPSGCDFVNPPCSSMVTNNRVTMADLLVGGWSFPLALNVIFPGAAPDVDLAGGAVATFTVARPSASMPLCQPVITGCMRGGQSLTRAECLEGGMSNAGYSAVLAFSASAVELTGVTN